MQVQKITGMHHCCSFSFLLTSVITKQTMTVVKRPSRMKFLTWYLLFGALHEAAHLGTASWLGVVSTSSLLDTCAILRALLLRQCVIPPLANHEKLFYSEIVRHAGWIASVLIMVLVLIGTKHNNENNKIARLAAVTVTLEALSTDLLGIFGSAPHVFFCGNFGILLLHKAWSNDANNTALDILATMVRVTSMRGAQSGGIVTFQPSGSRQKGIRCRVVNKKRTDLSQQLRKRIDRDVHHVGGGDVTFFAGHTRFATSSKATFEGTHPQQWTPPKVRRVYNMDVEHESTLQEFVPHNTVVENFVTHNGDFEYYKLNGVTYDLEVVQSFLQAVLGPMPASVDSCAIAGLVDVLRARGCFGLSARFAICLGLSTSTLQIHGNFPDYSHFEAIGILFEEVLGEMLKTTRLENIDDQSEVRSSFAMRVATKLEARFDTLMKSLQQWVSNDGESKATVYDFCLVTINAFFDNDLLETTKTFLQNAKGSFGLCVTSSLDAHRQMCLAARGQTMSVAFYPDKGLVCYGSEQAAVKAGINYSFPGANADVLGRSRGDLDNDALRLDLDDLGGEIVLLDWGRLKYKTPPTSKPNENLPIHELMNGALDVILYQESKATTRDPQLYHRMTRLTRNRFIKPLRPDTEDPVLADIQDIPKVCQSIQDEWQADKAATSLNRLTAFNLSRCLRTRLEAHIAGKTHPRAIDILLTGCEVSLWLAEQFASDLQKAFPNLRIKAISSNKLLGLYGQEIAVPALGFPDGPTTHHLHDSIVIIVSHSGGTFAPLSCSNLLQSQTKNIFVVTSEWDTQIGKQLRAMDEEDEDHIFNSHIFSTEVGMRPAEPCSVSVVATHQLLTNLFEYICVVILSDRRFRRMTGAVITETDLQILEKCNRENIGAMCEIVGTTTSGEPFAGEPSATQAVLRKQGNDWANHVLENVRAYMMTFVYIFVTVTIGYPLCYGVSVAAGLDPASNWMYLVRLFDSAIYFWMPQICITIIRLIQGRNLRHRMVGRTVVIGDIPYVAQAAEAFLSKLFACSYSIAGLNVLSGNPADHLVHRHTHRVVRGSLLVCGRPDGRLSALSTAEAAVCLSVNQASSIQSLGGTCESITIGHNPFKLPLTYNAIFLKRKRPQFLCERILNDIDVKEETQSIVRAQSSGDSSNDTPRRSIVDVMLCRRDMTSVLDSSSHHSSSRHDPSVKPRVNKRRSAASLIGAYANFEQTTEPTMEIEYDGGMTVRNVVDEAIKEQKWSEAARKLFHALDLDGNGLISEEDLVDGLYHLQASLSDDQLRSLFRSADEDRSGDLDYDEFFRLLSISGLQSGVRLPPSNRDERGIIQVKASQEKYFGETLRKLNAGTSDTDSVNFLLARSQHFAQELYETRIASLQRFVAMTVMFHQMGKHVRNFFTKISFGLLGYRIDRTHSIMRIATTASPVSGADVRYRMRQLQLLKKVQHSVDVISLAYLRYKARKAAATKVD